MTYPLPESAATLAAMETQMRASHRVRTLVQLQDYQHRVIRDLTSVRISGTVQVDADAEQSTRGLTLELLDPTDITSGISFGYVGTGIHQYGDAQAAATDGTGSPPTFGQGFGRYRSPARNSRLGGTCGWRRRWSTR